MNIFLLLVLVLPAVLLHLFISLTGKLFPPAKDGGLGSKDNAGTEESDGKTTEESDGKTVVESEGRPESAPEEIMSETEAGGSSDRPESAPEEIMSETKAGGSSDRPESDHEQIIMSETCRSSDHDDNQNTDGVNQEKTEVCLDKDEESEVFENDIVEEESVDEEDDWEGIESSQLEKLFWDAVVYVASKGNGDESHGLASDLKLQLYGLHKVAMEGPCYVPQPMALKVSARAKWNAWRQLGTMSPEEAMDKYIHLLTSSIPGWTEVQQQEPQDERTSCRVTS